MEISIPKYEQFPIIPMGLFCCYLLLSISFLPSYFILDYSFYLGIIMLPYLCFKESQSPSLRMLIPALLFIALMLLIPTRSTFFFSLLFSFLLLVESYRGKISLTFLLILTLLSPLFSSFSNALSFPLRLSLTELVAKSISLVGMKATAMGNLIILEGYEFYIDQACAGLHMLLISLLICLLILTFQLKKKQSTLSFLPWMLWLGMTFLLNLCSNYFRILLIVIFKIMPDHPLHHFVGIISLTIYVILPLIAVSSMFVKYFGKSQSFHQESLSVRLNTTSVPLTKVMTLIHVTFFGALLFSSFQIGKSNLRQHHNDNINLQGYQKSSLDNNILKFENAKALIYMKPSDFYAPEHNPMICWTGSGYEFQQIRKEIFRGTEVYTATLVKGKDRLYSSWWFDNGTIKTINQAQWRWQAAKTGSKFYLINVSTDKRSDLKKITEELLPSPLTGNP